MTFKLTATHSSYRANGFYLEKGSEITIHINMMGITPTNLFNNSRCKEQLIQQFRVNGIDLPPNDSLLTNRGNWDIKALL